MKIFLGSDHAGFKLKEKVGAFLKALNYEVEDLGAFEEDPLDDYPDFIKPVALAVLSNPGSPGIIFGKTGQGEAMCANRFKGIRAAVWFDGHKEILQYTRQHNDANILSIGAGFVEEDEVLEAIKLWLETPFSGDERHIRRIQKLDF